MWLCLASASKKQQQTNRTTVGTGGANERHSGTIIIHRQTQEWKKDANPSMDMEEEEEETFTTSLRHRSVQPSPTTLQPNTPTVKNEDNEDDGDGDEEEQRRHAAVKSSITEDDDDEEDRFLMDCHGIIELGLAAYRYGSAGGNVERFIKRLLEEKLRGVHKAVVRLGNAEVLCSIYRKRRFPVTMVLDLAEGYQLEKLGKLSDVCKQVQAYKVSLVDSIQVISEIESSADPYGLALSCFDWVVVGFALAPVLGGSWWDSLVAAALSLLTFWTSFTVDYCFPPRAQDPWNFFACAFLSSIVATTIQVTTGSQINIVLTTLSSIAIILPGFTVALGCAELVMGRILPGAAHLFKGLITMAWLTFGVYLGYILVLQCAGGGDTSAAISSPPEPVPAGWQALFVPLLCIGLALAFQVSFPHDFVWCILIQGTTYAIAYAFSYLQTDNLNGGDIGILVSSVLMTLISNLWSRWKDRPINIILVPCIVLQVSGTIGFRGIINLLQGDKTDGAEKILRMFVVAAYIIAGVLVGMAILPSVSTV